MTDYVCGGYERPGPRDECPEHLHDWPLPFGWVEASEAAAIRLFLGWTQTLCLTCGKYGWHPGRRMDRELPTLAPEPPPKPLADHPASTGATNAQRDNQETK